VPECIEERCDIVHSVACNLVRKNVPAGRPQGRTNGRRWARRLSRFSPLRSRSCDAPAGPLPPLSCATRGERRVLPASALPGRRDNAEDVECSRSLRTLISGAFHFIGKQNPRLAESKGILIRVSRLRHRRPHPSWYARVRDDSVALDNLPPHASFVPVQHRTSVVHVPDHTHAVAVVGAVALELGNLAHAFLRTLASDNQRLAAREPLLVANERSQQVGLEAGRAPANRQAPGPIVGERRVSSSGGQDTPDDAQTTQASACRCCRRRRKSGQ